MGETVRTFVMENGVWVAKRVPKGHRKPEWNNENRKTARKTRRARDSSLKTPQQKAWRTNYEVHYEQYRGSSGF